MSDATDGAGTRVSAAADAADTAARSVAGLREPVDREGRLEGSVPCRHCGYDLRGRFAGEACSECGTPIARSLRYYLRYSAPRWVREVSWGAGVLALCSAVSLIVFLWIGVAEGLSLGLKPIPILAVLAGASGIGALIGTGFGLWSITTAPPAGYEPPERGPQYLRRMLRAAPPAALMLLLLFGLIGQDVTDANLFDLFGLTLTGVCCLGVVALLFLHAAALMHRVPQRGLRRALLLQAAATAVVAALIVAGAAALAMRISLARATTFAGAGVVWHFGGPSPSGVAVATILSEVNRAAATGGNVTFSGRATLWVKVTLSVPAAAAGAALAAAAVFWLSSTVLLSLVWRALRRAAAEAARGP